MKFALMQPYFMPYIGYWQLINEVDLIVISDDTKYVKQSWINRNRIWSNGRISYVTLPLKSESDFLPINLRNISTEFNQENLIQKILQDYRTCGKSNIESLLRQIVSFEDRNLATFLVNSIQQVQKLLDINTEIILASDVKIPNNLKGKERIYYLSKILGISSYVNLPGGQEIYLREEFKSENIELQFISPNLSRYETKVNSFQPGLSVIDLFFNLELSDIQNLHLTDYQLV